MKNIKKLLSIWSVGVLVFFFVTSVSMASTTKNYLMWQMPSTVAFPVYVYSGGAQIDYLYGTTQQAFLGEYDPSSTNGTYELYYKASASTWKSCEFVIKKGVVDINKTSCPGAVINSPVSKSNVYTVAFGASSWPGNKTPVKPVNTDYGKRKITFKNETKYSMIRIGEVCTKSVNLHNPNCINTQNLFQIAQGKSIDFLVDEKSKEKSHFPAGIDSYAFTLTAYKDKTGNWVKTGGYNAGGTPYATKIELTSKPVTTNANKEQFPQGATNFDVSAVDGYNISIKAYPQNSTYCTYTVPPENSNILGAGYYSKKNPLGALYIEESICKASSQLPANGKGAWELTLNSKNGDFKGCMSPCTYAKINKSASKNLFCCAGKYDTPGTCDQPAGKKGANNSTYVTNLNPPTSNHIYRFAYDDAVGDFACPAETDFVISFMSLRDL